MQMSNSSPKKLKLTVNNNASSNVILPSNNNSYFPNLNYEKLNYSKEININHSIIDSEHNKLPINNITNIYMTDKILNTNINSSTENEQLNMLRFLQEKEENRLLKNRENRQRYNEKIKPYIALASISDNRERMIKFFKLCYPDLKCHIIEDIVDNLIINVNSTIPK